MYPLFLAGALFVFQGHFWGVQILQCLMSGLICIILYHIGKRIFDWRAGLVSAFLYAVYPYSIWYFPRVKRENLLIFLVVISILVLMRVLEELKVKHSVALGILLGLTTLCKPITLYFPLFLFPFFMIKYWNGKRKALAHFLVICGLMAIVILPWSLRNLALYNHLIPVSVGKGETLYMHNVLNDYGKPSRLIEQEDPFVDRRQALENRFRGENDVLKTDKALFKEGVDYILQHPGVYINKVLERAQRFWYWADDPFTRSYGLWIQIMYLLPGFAGLVVAVKEKKNIWALLIMFGYFFCIYVPIHATARYTFPIMPVFMVFGAHFLVKLVQMLSPKYRERIPVEI